MAVVGITVVTASALEAAALALDTPSARDCRSRHCLMLSGARLNPCSLAIRRARNHIATMHYNLSLFLRPAICDPKVAFRRLPRSATAFALASALVLSNDAPCGRNVLQTQSG